MTRTTKTLAILLILLTGCSPRIILGLEPYQTDCYLDHACLPRHWQEKHK